MRIGQKKCPSFLQSHLHRCTPAFKPISEFFVKKLDTLGAIIKLSGHLLTC
jgi:hypothetical protein